MWNLVEIKNDQQTKSKKNKKTKREKEIEANLTIRLGLAFGFFNFSYLSMSLFSFIYLFFFYSSCAFKSSNYKFCIKRKKININNIGDLFNIYKKMNYDKDIFYNFLRNQCNIYIDFHAKNITKQIDMIKEMNL